jgi:hypothetical protein
MNCGLHAEGSLKQLLSMLTPAVTSYLEVLIELLR